MYSATRILVLLLLCALAFGELTPASYAKRRRGGHDGDEDNDDDDQANGTTSNTTSTPANASAGNGDTKCTALLCVSAIVNTNSTVTYVVQSRGAASLGWMAIGFGSQMLNSPMVVMWPNADGTITISQRQASAHTMPTVVASPPRVATPVDSLSATSGTNPKLAFSIPANSDTLQNVIWAFASAPPSSSAKEAIIQQHLQSGTVQLDLTAQSASFDPIAAANSGSGSPQTQTPYQEYQKLLIAHAVLCSIGFIILLPTGVYIARFLRVSFRSWFKGHAYTQFWISGPVILTGFILAVVGVQKAEAPHFNDTHKRLGLAIIICYCVQCSLGAFIHWVKDPNRTRRPPQNYLHAVFGLSIIALSLYQVRLGFKTEWPTTTGRDDVPEWLDKLWLVWTIVLSVAYASGLLLLKKQFRHAKEARELKTSQSGAESSPEYIYRRLERT